MDKAAMADMIRRMVVRCTMKPPVLVTDDLGEVGGAPNRERTQRCRLAAHRVLLAAVPPGDASS